MQPASGATPTTVDDLICKDRIVRAMGSFIISRTDKIC